METIRIEDRWYVLATSSRTDDRTRVLKSGETFAIFDRFGDIQPIGTGEQGVYHQGTRFLSQLELRLNGHRPMLLGSSVRQDNSLLGVDLTTPDCYEEGELTVLKGSVHAFRATLLADGTCHTRVRIANYGNKPVALRVALEFGADYADIFEVRGVRRPRRGEDFKPELRPDRVLLGYRGLDGVTRRTEIECDPVPARLGPNHVEYALALAPNERSEIHVAITCDPREPRPARASFVALRAEAERALQEAPAEGARVLTSNEQFNEWIHRSSADLAMLTLHNPERGYPYAGVPWYSTPFGRDGILTALEYLWVDPSLARGVLAYLAETQARDENPEQDAEPGKILHETRKGELAALGEIPFGRYYGTVDATPLFIVLAGAYYRRTGDIELVRAIWPNIERALGWIERYGDSDRDGFVEYRRKSAKGLAQQGWKDSEDSVFHRNGVSAEGSIALAEVQGYVYKAKLAAADLAEALGEGPRVSALRASAHALQERFERAFWCEDLGTYALALDGEKRPCRVRASNAGQVLWSGIASQEHAERTAATLLEPRSFSGWGIRTIAEGEARYNPMSYHNGSIWPHDNALIAKGFARYGLKEGSQAILGAMLDASLFMDLHRLPELFCGFTRRPGEGPTLYPVACSPQAWASASVFYVLQACLGMSFRVSASGIPRIRFDHPQLPASLARVEIRNLRVGGTTTDLLLHRHPRDVGVNVLHKEGDVEVAVVI
ncbi:glycogen debranching N-terminal domain-containing protein [Pendulispora albinea]|uniref:Amylo-alpha-1,6-glucosidase n=1 Tax=Pendulispora albinea TaxID=2741071 RepID=A0ABZ2M019_9BACT